MRAYDLIRRSVEMYRQADAYVDAGSVSVTHIMKNRKWTEQRPFETLLYRGRGFWFQFFDDLAKDHARKSVVSSAGGEALLWWWRDPRIEASMSLGEALGSVQGVSRGSACRIPFLLMDIVGPEATWLFENYGEAVVSGNEDVHGEKATLLHRENHRREVERFYVPSETEMSPAELAMTRDGGIEPGAFLLAAEWKWRSIWLSEADGRLLQEAECTVVGEDRIETITSWRSMFGSAVNEEPRRFEIPTRPCV